MPRATAGRTRSGRTAAAAARTSRGTGSTSPVRRASRRATEANEVEIAPQASLHGHVTLRLAVLGDSVAYGTGASRASETPASRLVAMLAAAGLPAEPRVFAVPGAVSADLAAQVERARAWRPDVA